jgi:type II secretion system protein G
MRMNKIKKIFLKNKGFTLIELLVVVSIISLLASVVLASVTNAKMQARDARRLQDIHQIQLALDLYYNDHGQYPSVGWYISADSVGWGAFQTLLAPYISKLPHDPKEDPASSGTIPADGGQNYAYSDWYADPCPGQHYIIEYNLEIAKGPNPGVVICPSVSTTPYAAISGVADTKFKAVGVSGR